MSKQKLTRFNPKWLKLPDNEVSQTADGVNCYGLHFKSPYIALWPEMANNDLSFKPLVKLKRDKAILSLNSGWF